jgi:hypothetical protein
MGCSTCDDLRRQLAAAHEELEAWRAHGQSEERHAALVGRVHAWRGLFTLTPKLGYGPAIVLMALVDRAGRIVSRGTLFEATRVTPWRRLGDFNSEHSSEHVVAVHLSRLRGAMRLEAAAGRLPDVCRRHDAGIESAYGGGYMIPKALAAELRALVEVGE